VYFTTRLRFLLKIAIVSTPIRTGKCCVYAKHKLAKIVIFGLSKCENVEFSRCGDIKRPVVTERGEVGRDVKIFSRLRSFLSFFLELSSKLARRVLYHTFAI
jgi:hypothetical protein